MSHAVPACGAELPHPSVQDEWILSLLNMPFLGLGRQCQHEAGNPDGETTASAPEFGNQRKPSFPIEPPEVANPSC